MSNYIFEPIPEIDNLREVGPFLKSYHILTLYTRMTTIVVSYQK